MDNQNKDIKDAINDIFGSDFIEINTDESKNIKNDELASDVVFKDSEEPQDSYVLNETVTNDKISDDSKINIIPKDSSSNEPEKPKENKDLVNSNKINDNKNKSFFNSKKIIIIFIIGFILGIALIYILVNYVFGVTKVVNCSSSATDEGYKYTDEYKITYKKNKITYVESTYTYTALNEEYKGQIEYVKDDKLRVLINSNGMSGFTYTYENNDEYFKINGYLDFELFNYEQIKEINQESTPISYFKISSDLTFKDLKEELEDNGYQCINSK